MLREDETQKSQSICTADFGWQPSNSESTMLLANKEAVMTVLDTLTFVAFNPLQNNNPVAVRRRKLIVKID